jgi:hypothetical protein
MYLLGPSIRNSRSALFITCSALTLTAVLAIVVKRENLLIVPVVLLVSMLFRIDKESIDVPRRRLQRMAALVTVTVCASFALNQLRLLEVVRREQMEYSVFPFSVDVWKMMLPAFVKGYLSLSWYFGSAVLVLVGALSIKSRRRGLYAFALFASYLLLYTSHVRSYYQLHGGAVGELDTFRYSMNLAGLWAIMAGQGLAGLTVQFSKTKLRQSSRALARRIAAVCLVGCVLCSWVVTDRLKEDMVANESAVRIQPAEAALQEVQQRGTPDTFVISVEPLVVQMLAPDPVNVIDFKDLSSELLHKLRSENPSATFFYLEQDIHNSRVDRGRYRKSFDTVEAAHKMLLVHADHYSIFEVL